MDATSWMRQLPVGVEITSCTKADFDTDGDGTIAHGGEVATNVASMRIDYRADEDGGKKLSSYTCQVKPQ
jgi:hypothetical protein